MFNFNNFNNNNVVNNPENPKDIFMALNRNENFKYLWDVQSEVLQKWWNKRTNKNNIIKMNTGSGKTLVSLLILQSFLNINDGNAVYVVPDKYLAEQVEKTANEIGIKTTDNERDSKFLSKKAILIITINELVNGMSKFGMRKNGKNILIDNLIMDDVHSCINIIKNQYSIKISINNPIYTKIFNLFKNNLCSYMKITEKTLENLLQPYSGENLLIPFWIWNENITKIKEIFSLECLKPENEKSEFIKFNYPLIEDSLNSCRCFITSEYIEISPKCIPIHKISSFENAKHRIFLSATLPDLTIFNSVLNISKEDILSNIICPRKAYDIGERMILFPQYIDGSISDDEVVEKIKTYTKINILVLVPSKYRAKYWEKNLNGYDYQILSTALEIKNGLSKIKNETFKGITIIINKYDGIDLPNDFCRLIVIDKLPNIESSFDKYEKKILPESQRISKELIQKIEQGMGRGIRSNTDYCGIILMNATLIEAMYLQNTEKYFSEATQTQIKLAEDLWNQAEDNKENMYNLLEYMFNRNESWINASKNSLIKCEYKKDVTLNDLELVNREAFNEFQKGNYNNAVKVLQEFLNKSNNNNAYKGYIKMLIAEYYYFINPTKAQDVLKSGFSLNSNILKPMEGVSYRKVKNIGIDQANNLNSFLKKFNKPNEVLIKVNSILDKLKFEEDTASDFESAINELGKILGFETQMPEKEFSDGGPDNLWILDNDNYFIIECKNGTTTNTICKNDIGQLLSSIQWFKNEYHDSKYYAIMIHNSYIADSHANPDSNILIMDPINIEILKNKVRSLYIEICRDDLIDNPKEINRLLKYYSLNSDLILNYFKKIKK